MSQPILIATVMRPEGDTGVQTHFRALLAWARDRKYPMALCTPFDCPRWQVNPVFAVRRVIDVLSKPASVWWYRRWHAFFLHRALREALADGTPCTVYAQCPLSAEAALRARRTPQQRVVMVVHFNLSQAGEWCEKGMIDEGGRLYRAIESFEADVLPRVDGLLFVSRFMRDALSARVPAVGQVAYRVVPNFLADPQPETDTGKPVRDLICIGTLEPRKNQSYALDIVSASVRIGRPLSLTIVGDGPDGAALQARVEEKGLQGLISFAGFVRNAALLMRQHRACLHVSRMENLPLVLIEALARGLPVFAPAVGGVPEVFDDGKEGRSIPLDDAERAARMISEWLDAPQSMDLARLAARERFLSRFEASQVATALVDFLSHPHASASTAAHLTDAGVAP